MPFLLKPYFSGLDVEKCEAEDTYSFLSQLLLDCIDFLAVLMHLWATECRWFGLCAVTETQVSCPAHVVALSCCPVQWFCLWSRDETESQAPWNLCHRCATAAATPGRSGCFRQLLACRLWSKKAVRGDTCPCGGTVSITIRKAQQEVRLVSQTRYIFF